MSHAIFSDIDYVGAFLFEATTKPADPAEMVPPEDTDGYADSPPPISGYRKADVAGMACWNCGHFTITPDTDGDGDIDGICNLFEALADGEFTCDRFTAHADLLRQSPHSSWSEDMADAQRNASLVESDFSDSAVMNIIGFADEDAAEEDGLIWKDILRTGKWTHTPTSQGIVKKTLQIVRDGESDPGNGIISLAEVFRNFQDKAVPYVTIPLSDEENKDHKNIARVNTGFVRKLKMIDRDGMTYLVAGMDFTEPDVKQKVLRGTIPDCSAAIPFGVTRRSDNKTFNAVLDHVCLTRKPFVDKLAPFGIAASDGDEELPVEAWEPEASESETAPAQPPAGEPAPEQEEPEAAPPETSEPVSMSFKDLLASIRNAMTNQLRLGPEYVVDDIRGTIAIISHSTSGAAWEVQFRLTGNSEAPVVLASVNTWKIIQNESETETESVPVTAADQLHRAQELRELRLAQPTSDTGGIQMSDLLDGVELSDEARTRVEGIIAENARLQRTSRSGEADKRITELEALGLKDRPGALKLYRSIYLSDDGGAAAVLFSDDGDENNNERLTATQILDRFIDAMKGENGVELSDQHLASGNDNKPPTDASEETKPLEERVEESRTALYGDREKRRTGRK